MKKLILQIKYGGVGDHLLFSPIPKIAKETGGYDTIYISELSPYRQIETRNLVWEQNPYVDGFVPDKGIQFDKAQSGVNSKTNVLDSLMLLHGLDDGKRFHEPELYISTKPIQSLRKAVIYDPNYISKVGNFVKKDIDNYLAKKNIIVTHQMKLRERHIPIDCSNIIETKSLMDFCNIIISCKQMICLTTGTATIAAALGIPITVLYAKPVMQTIHHSKLHAYVDVKK